MKNQTWFETDLGYMATKEKLLQSKVITDGDDYCGRLTFRLKDLKDFTVQITTKGKLSISYPEGSDYKVVLERLKPYLVKAEGLPVRTIRVMEFDKLPKETAREDLWRSYNHIRDLWGDESQAVLSRILQVSRESRIFIELDPRLKEAAREALNQSRLFGEGARRFKYGPEYWLAHCVLEFDDVNGLIGKLGKALMDITD